MRLLCNEIKKAMQMKHTYVYAIAILGITIFFAGYCVFVSRAEKVSADGSLEIVNGSAAIPIQKNTDRPCSGQVTEEKLKDALQAVQGRYDKRRDEFLYDQDFLECQRLFGLINELNYVYPQYNEKTYSSVDEIPLELAGSYYALRAGKIDKMIDAFYASDGQRETARKLGKDVQVPFSYYEGCGFWNAALDYYAVLLVAVLLAAALFAAPAFAQDYRSGADLIFRTTEYGRGALGLCRVVVAELYGIFLFAVASTVFFGVCISFFGAQGLGSSIQMMTIYAIADLTYGQALVYAILGGFISVVGTVGMAAFFSAKAKNPIASVAASMAFILAWKIASMLWSSPAGSLFRLIFMAFPMGGTEMANALSSMSIFRLFGVHLWEPHWIMLAGSLIGVIFFFAAVHAYAGKKARG